MAFKLIIVEAKRIFFPVKKTDKAGNQIYNDDGTPATAMMPGGYRITFQDGTWATVTSCKGVAKFSYWYPGSPVFDMFGKKTGKRTPDQKQLDAVTWDKLNNHRRYSQIGLPQAILDGMEMADEEIAARMAA